MSMHTQLVRGLMALPVAALLILAGAMAPARSTSGDCAVATVVPADTATGVGVPGDLAPLRTVDFHSMIPGALHVIKRVKVGQG